MFQESFQAALLRAERDLARRHVAALRGQMTALRALLAGGGSDPLEGAIRDLADGRARMDGVVARIQELMAERDVLRARLAYDQMLHRRLDALAGDAGIKPVADGIADVAAELETWVPKARAAAEALEQVRLACRPETTRLSNFANHINKVNDLARVREYLGAGRDSAGGQ